MSQASRCRTHSVTARARATCSSGTSGVRPCTNAQGVKANSWAAEHGAIRLSTYLVSFRVGDIVDIKANAAQQRGMPHKYYHGYVGSHMDVHSSAEGTRCCCAT